MPPKKFDFELYRSLFLKAGSKPFKNKEPPYSAIQCPKCVGDSLPLEYRKLNKGWFWICNKCGKILSHQELLDFFSSVRDDAMLFLNKEERDMWVEEVGSVYVEGSRKEIIYASRKACEEKWLCKNSREITVIYVTNPTLIY